jgi:molybdate/tungstate transport system substrate-binding protein
MILASHRYSQTLKLAALAVAAGSLAACGSAASTAAKTTKVSGTANVAYAGSLQLLNEKTVGPAFSKATGYGYQGRGGGSFGLAKEIQAGEISPNVFESVGPAPIKTLYPKFTSWYVQFASSPIVVAYNPHTTYAPTLEKIARGQAPLQDLFTLMEQPGFLLGRTNPNTDPQGQAFYEMVELATKRFSLGPDAVTKILGPLDNPSQVFQETALEARLESGQLDAASAFLSQAVQLHLPYIALPASMNFGNPALASTYASASVTLDTGKTVHGVPLTLDITEIGKSDASAAQAFIKYAALGSGRSELKDAGYTLLKPQLSGTGVPKEIRDAIDG